MYCNEQLEFTYATQKGVGKRRQHHLTQQKKLHEDKFILCSVLYTVFAALTNWRLTRTT
jgi:hypothetical protein